MNRSRFRVLLRSAFRFPLPSSSSSSSLSSPSIRFRLLGSLSFWSKPLNCTLSCREKGRGLVVLISPDAETAKGAAGRSPSCFTLLCTSAHLDACSLEYEACSGVFGEDLLSFVLTGLLLKCTLSCLLLGDDRNGVRGEKGRGLVVLISPDAETPIGAAGRSPSCFTLLCTSAHLDARLLEMEARSGVFGEDLMAFVLTGLLP
jgi:hypothetical protein